MASDRPQTSRRRASLIPFRPQTSLGLLPGSASNTSNVALPLPRSPSIDALRRIDRALVVHQHQTRKRSFEPGSRWSTHFPAHDTPEDSLSVSHAESSVPLIGTPAQCQQHLLSQQQQRQQLMEEQQRQQEAYGRRYTASGSNRRRASVSTASSHGHSFLSQARSLVRRASTTLAGQPTKVRRGSNQRLDIPEENLEAMFAPDTRPYTALDDFPPAASCSKPPTSKRNSFLKRMRSFRSRRDGFSSASGQNQMEYTFPYPMHAPQAQSSNQLHQFDWPRPGAAARASAAAASAAGLNTMHVAASSQGVGGVRAPGLTRKDTKCSRSTRLSATIDVETLKRSDTAMEVDSVMSPFEDRTVDPFTVLPPELATQVLSHLDHQSLSRAAAVSRAWNEQASPNNRSLWRQLFLKRFEPTHTMDPKPLQMGGAGVGKNDRVDRDWQRMYRTRIAIDRNWNHGTPAAVYFQGHTDSVYCAQFDEHKIITGSRDRTIRVWDINTYECIKVIGGPNSKPVRPPMNEQALECHPSTVHKGVNLNGTREGDTLFHRPRKYHEASVLCLQFDSEILVTGSSDSTCIVWDINTFEPIRELVHHTAGVLDVCFDSRYIVSCSKDNKICVWSRATGELLRVLAGHQGPVNAVQMRGNFLVSASGDGMSKLWCLERFSCLRNFHSKDRGLAAVEFSDDGRHVLAGGNDQVIYKYDAISARLVHTYAGHQGLVRSLFLDSQNGRVVSGSYDQAMRVYDFRTGNSLGGDPSTVSFQQALEAQARAQAQHEPQPLGAPQPHATTATGAAVIPYSRTGAYENWTTSWILSAKADYRRIVATSQDGRALLMDFGRGVDPAGLELLKGI